MKQVSQALDERMTGDWYFNSARAKRPATANSTQHFQARGQDAGGFRK
ncbi:hypothetical protein IQ229_09450 [Nostoc cf. edaphicum LEGE 07299]|uniref:Uncharacterized protein n=1 Tax=Nostoc cf. edaphicum LEGE 07299 TaxID=2777974 RepID=A0ABR9TXK8_9NOSO|nr:hypothetical protein [Nostoc edaphicum]MBE9105154.1 hypothetical protein [Nostoc cf. edaphicum LEGE 07299]